MKYMVDSLMCNDGADSIIQMSSKLGVWAWGDIIALIALAVSVIIFLCQMGIERNNRNNNQKKTWFLEVIVKPRLDELHRSYLVLLEDIVNINKELRSNDSIIPASSLRELQSTRMAELFNSISNQLEPFSMLVKSYDVSLGERLSSVENMFVDEASDIINNYNSNSDEDIRRRVLENYQTYIAVLYSQFSVKNSK